MFKKAAWLLTASIVMSTIPMNFSYAAENTAVVEPGMEMSDYSEEIFPGEERAPEELIEAVAETESQSQEETAVVAETEEAAPETAEAAPAEAEEETPETDESLEIESGFSAMDAGAMLEQKISGFDKDGTKTIFRNDDGTLAAGWKAVNNKWYYFDTATNEMKTGLISVGGKTYFLDQNGIMLSSSWKTVNGNKYYFTAGGDAQTGWGAFDGKWYYFGSDGAMTKGWQQAGKDWFFLDESTGVMKTGWFTNAGKTYYLNKSGNMQTGWGMIDGKWYYFYGTGQMVTGWIGIEGKWYLFSDKGVMQNGWITEGKETRYLNKNGDMQTGWGKIDNNWYYFNGYGVLQRGWQEIGGKWYYLDSESAVMQSGWIKQNNAWYYLDASNGSMHLGPTFVGGTLWYLDRNSGKLVENSQGWKRLGDSDKWYFVYNDGHCAVDTRINGYVIDQYGIWYDDPLLAEAMKYSSPTKYLIVADRERHWLAIFEGSKGNWTKIKGNWRITTGSDETPTPLGEHWVHFKDDSPYGWQAFTESKAAWCSYITGGFYIHSILYAKNYSYNLSPNNTPVLDGDLGYNLSHSCIRLKTENAKWVYDNIPEETKVVVFESTYDYD